MSTLTGYLTIDGYDLSYVFHSKNNNTFENVITVNVIIGSPSNLTYTSNKIGYINTINAETTNKNIISGNIINLTAGFSLPIGMYLCVAYGYNIYTGSGNLIDFSLGVSTNQTSSVNGFFIPISTSIILPNSTYKFIIGNTLQPLQVTTASDTFYLIQRITTSGIASIKNSDGSITQSYFKYLRIA
jgi:hypothetical protein